MGVSFWGLASLKEGFAAAAAAAAAAATKSFGYDLVTVPSSGAPQEETAAAAATPEQQQLQQEQQQQQEELVSRIIALLDLSLPERIKAAEAAAEGQDELGAPGGPFALLPPSTSVPEEALHARLHALHGLGLYEDFPIMEGGPPYPDSLLHQGVSPAMEGAPEDSLEGAPDDSLGGPSLDSIDLPPLDPLEGPIQYPFPDPSQYPFEGPPVDPSEETNPDEGPPPLSLGLSTRRLGTDVPPRGPPGRGPSTTKRGQQQLPTGAPNMDAAGGPQGQQPYNGEMWGGAAGMDGAAAAAIAGGSAPAGGGGVGLAAGAPLSSRVFPYTTAAAAAAGGAAGGAAGAAGGAAGGGEGDKKAPHEYYAESKKCLQIKGLRWSPDPRVLHPHLLQDLIGDTVTPELSKERALWQEAYGFNKEITVTSAARRGGRFKLVFTDVLGAGGIGVVLSAIDITNNRRLAVKVCRLRNRSRRGPQYDQDVLKRRVQQEISLWRHVPPGLDVQQWAEISQVVIPLDLIEPIDKIVASHGDTIVYSQEWVIFDVFAGDLLSISEIWKGRMPVRIEVTKQVM
ncbi:Rhoptry kinase family protein ROP21, putative [Eimeria maxima]|uniref:Rhoptry kinase family protein ROP21, putative n=1 Tax=Eimeria maxima TaxID=5804 RepID=U6M6J5_EIMMA|nr:Rhoptry kinase family protein ROP21, putative [Eimeria maxima]CDJ58688.1 Rhoptry kinase family protein ROP21, putative [Eimeria maxima]